MAESSIQFSGEGTTSPLSIPGDQVIIYSDWNFNLEDFNLAVNVEAIMNSLINLISTIPGERLNNPEYGIDIESELFEIMDL